MYSFLLIIFIIATPILESQTNIQVQYRNRGEFANSLKIFEDDKLNQNYSTGQRTRLGVFHNSEFYEIGVQIQDVRYWGQDRSTIAPFTDPSIDGLMLHQAYLDIKLESLLKFKSNFKIGRQEIIFDDVRLFGNLNWLHQARRHDIALLKLSPNDKNNLQIGYAFNQNGFKKNGSLFNGIGGIYPSGSNGLSQNYKTLGLMLYENKNNILPFNFIFANDNFSEIDSSSNPTTETFARYTIGGKLLKNFDDFVVNLSYYQQLGNNPTGHELNANMILFDASYKLNKLKTTIGYDFLSGTDITDKLPTDENINTFDPLYGTPHKYFGYLDLFYAPIGQGLNGFSDAYIMLDYKATEKFSFQLSGHYFNLTNQIIEQGEELDSYIGTEIDFVSTYKLFNKIKIDLGVLVMFANSTLFSESVMNIPNYEKTPYMMYLMIDVTDLIKI